MDPEEYEHIELESRLAIMDEGGVRRISHLLGQIIASDLQEADKARILGDNARALFGVTPPG
jgi:hypothetical protein